MIKGGIMGFTPSHLSELAQLLRVAARAEIMPRFRKLGAGDVRMKTGPRDLVTDADVFAERMITQGLSRLFPGCLVVGEEAAAADPGLVGQLAGATLAFTVDPVDGTSNFAAGLPLFGVMASAVVQGEVVGAVILDPVVDSFSAALLGQGAWEEAADGTVTPLRVAAPAKIGDMTGSVSWRFMPPGLKAAALAALPRFAQVWDHRCAAHEYRTLAAGHGHFVVFNKLMPWDHLPGVLLHREAGGVSAKFDGTAYRPGDVTGGLICAPDQAGLEAIRGMLPG
jgi:fructose-1,6-bisphosphatase/inositol monophosphatase family enzyme